MKHTTLFLICGAIALAHAIPSPPDASAPKDLDAAIQSPASDRPKELGWQSLFWGLFALALLAMSQPSVSDRDFPQSNLLFAMRSSPFICMADMIDVLYHWGAGLWRGLSISEAAFEVTWRRHCERLGTLDTTLEATSVERSPFASLILFVGAVTQAVKILACRGIPWAQMAAVSYIASYAVLAAVALASQSQRDEEFSARVMNIANRQRMQAYSNVTKTSLAFGIGAQMLLLCFGTSNLVPKLTWLTAFFSSRWMAEFLYTFVSLVWGMFAIAVLIGILVNGIDYLIHVVKAIKENDRAMIPAVSAKAIRLFSFVTLPSCCIFFWYKYINRIIDWLDAACMFFVGGGISLFIGLGTGVLLLQLAANRTSLFIAEINGPKSVAISLAINNLVIAALYYSYVYDPAGTIKPSWTEKLG